MYFNQQTDTKINWDCVDMAALTKLDQARQSAGIPFQITSHYRTPEHSIEVGGLRADAHTEQPCSAFDIAFATSHEAFIILSSLFLAGFHRIGVNWKNHHIHVDASTKLPQDVFWNE